MDRRLAWRVLDFFWDVFNHHRKFTPFQKFIFFTFIMGVLVALMRSWDGVLIGLNYCLSVYCAIKLLNILSERNVFMPTDRVYIWIELISDTMSVLFKRQLDDKNSIRGSGNMPQDVTKQKDFQISELENQEKLASSKVQVSNCPNHDYHELESELQKLTKLIHKDFFISWYDLFTKDELVWSEAEIVLIMIFDSLKSRLKKSNVQHILKSIMILYRTHVYNLKEAEFMYKAQSKRRKSSSRPKETKVGSSTKFDVKLRKSVEECYRTKTELHPALKSVKFEQAYQKAIVDCLALHLLPNELLQIKTLMTAIKEILSVNLLQNIMASLSDPIFLYEKVIIITSDEDPLECKEKKSDIQIVCDDKDNTQQESVHSILVKKDSGGRVTAQKSDNDKAVTEEEKSDSVKWKDDIKMFPVSKSFCCECNRLCSKDRDKITPRPHTCSVGSEEEVQKYDRLSVHEALSDSDSIGSRTTPFKLSVSDSDSEIQTEDRQSSLNIPGIETIPSIQEGGLLALKDKPSVLSNHDLNSLHVNSTIGSSSSAETVVTPEQERGTKNFSLPNLPNIFPKFNLNLPKPLSAIQKPITIGPLKLSPSDYHSDKEDENSDLVKSHSSGPISHSHSGLTPNSPRDTMDMNGSAEQQPMCLFQDIKIISTESAKEPGSGSLYTLYEIEYDALYQTESKLLVTKTGRVKRRFREFVNLQTRLEESSEFRKIMKDIKGPKKILPSLPFGNMGRETLENRKALLDGFLQGLIKKDVICSSEELKQFLGYSGDGHIAFVRKPSETSIPRIDQRLVKTMSGVFDKIVEGLPSLPQQIPKMIPSFESPDDKKDEPEQLDDKDNIDINLSFDLDETIYECTVDKFMYERHAYKVADDSSTSLGNISVDLGVSMLSWQNKQNTSSRSPSPSQRLAQFSRNIANKSSPYSSTDNIPSLMEKSEKLKKKENKPQPDDTLSERTCPVSDGLLDILTELLRGQDNWMCRETVMKSTRLVFGKGLNKYLETKIEHLTSEQMNSFYLKKLREAFWPDSVFTSEEKGPLTDLQREVLMKQARRCLGEFLPGILKAILGSDDFQHLLDEVMHSVKYEELNRHVWYSILDLVIEEIFPEINSQELQRKLSTAVEKS